MGRDTAVATVIAIAILVVIFDARGYEEDRKATRFGLGDDACMEEIVGLALCLGRIKIHTKGADRIIQSFETQQRMRILSNEAE
jgi:hypothetical protein